MDRKFKLPSTAQKTNKIKKSITGDNGEPKEKKRHLVTFDGHSQERQDERKLREKRKLTGLVYNQTESLRFKRKLSQKK
jgi:hypothetical protein